MQGVEKVLRQKEKKNTLLPCAKKNTRQIHILSCAFCLAHSKLLTLPCDKEKPHGKVWICRVPKKAHGKVWICRVFFLNRVFLLWHTAKQLFAVCPIESTRQTIKHTANIDFPVVIVHAPFLHICFFYNIFCAHSINNVPFHVFLHNHSYPSV